MTGSSALVGLAAVLCDLRDYEEALPLAERAIALDSANPAALQIAARCCGELAAVLERSGVVSHPGLAQVRQQAKRWAELAAAAQHEPAADHLRRRRERTGRLATVPVFVDTTTIPVDQPTAAVTRAPASDLKPPTGDEPPRVVDSEPSRRRRGRLAWLRRLWKRDPRSLSGNDG
jgi:hypothetical protein